MARLQVDIVTQEEQLLSAEVSQITLPGQSGEITVMPGHAPVMTTLSAGEVTLWLKEGVRRMIVSPGFAQVAGDAVTVLVDSAVREEVLSEHEAMEARQAAEQAMSQALSETEIAMTLGTIERTLMEMQAIRRGRGPRHAPGTHHH